MIGFYRIGREILTHAIQIRCREQLVLLFYIASRKNIARAITKKKKTLPDFPARTERVSGTRTQATSNEQRDFRAEATDSASRYSNPFLIHLFLLYVRDYSSIGSHSGKRCSTRIECELTRSDLFRLRTVVRHHDIEIMKSTPSITFAPTSSNARIERGIRPSIEYVYYVYRIILENIFHHI